MSGPLISYEENDLMWHINNASMSAQAKIKVMQQAVASALGCPDIISIGLQQLSDTALAVELQSIPAAKNKAGNR